jgi:hypothetical protein
MSPDERKLHDCIFMQEFLEKNPDIQLNLSKHQGLSEALESVKVRKALVKVKSIFVDTPGYNWNLGILRYPHPLSIIPINSEFHNATLARIAIESRRRSAPDIGKARGKRQSVVITIIFPRFNPLPNFSFFGTVIFLYLGPILYSELGPFSHITEKTYSQIIMKVFSQISVANISKSLHNSARNFVSPKTETVCESVWSRSSTTPAPTGFIADCHDGQSVAEVRIDGPIDHLIASNLKTTRSYTAGGFSNRQQEQIIMAQDPPGHAMDPSAMMMAMEMMSQK